MPFKHAQSTHGTTQRIKRTNQPTNQTNDPTPHPPNTLHHTKTGRRGRQPSRSMQCQQFRHLPEWCSQPRAARLRQSELHSYRAVLVLVGLGTRLRAAGAVAAYLLAGLRHRHSARRHGCHHTREGRSVGWSGRLGSSTGLAGVVWSVSSFARPPTNQPTNQRRVTQFELEWCGCR